MVRPGRRSDQNARLRVGRRDQLEAETKRAATAGSLQSGNAIVVGMLAKQDRADQLGEALVARASEIGLGFLRLEQDALGILDDLEGSASGPAPSRKTPTPTSIFSGRGSALQSAISARSESL